MKLFACTSRRRAWRRKSNSW